MQWSWTPSITTNLKLARSNIWDRRLTLTKGREVGKQKLRREPEAEAKAARLLEQAGQVYWSRPARYLESVLWLHTLTTSTLRTLLNLESLRTALALRVGADVFESHVCLCVCRMDERGLNRPSCKFSAGRYPRHVALNDIIKRGLQSAGILSVLKPEKADRADGKRPDGITVFSFSNRRSVY